MAKYPVIEGHLLFSIFFRIYMMGRMTPDYRSESIDNDQSLLYEDLTHKIIGISYTIMNELKGWFFRISLS